MSKKTYKLTIEPLTCIHVGNGEELTFLDYTIRQRKSGESLYMKFSSDSILHRIAKNPAKTREFEIASSSENMKSLQNFFQNNFSLDEDLEYPCEVTKEFNELYLLNKGKDPFENSAIVQQMYRPAGKKTPVIPGSSLKGAVRTAVLNEMLSEVSDSAYARFEKLCKGGAGEKPNYKKLNEQIQKELLGNYRDGKDDPFRTLEFSDCIFPAKNSQIVGVLKVISTNQHSGELFRMNDIQIQAEAIKGQLMGSCEKGECLLRLNTDIIKQKGVAKALEIKDIVNACNENYWFEFEEEYNKFYKDAAKFTTKINELYSLLEEIQKKENQFIIRLGQWSQVEFITFEENLRVPKTNKYGNTRTVFNYDGQYLPFGWCKCTVEEV